MELVKLDFVAFIDGNVNPEHSTIPTLMSDFSWLELFPLFVQETNLLTQSQTKVMSLTNQISGFQIVFNTDKLLFTQNFRPGLTENYEDLIRKFNKDVGDCLVKLNSMFYEGRTFKRFAFVTTAVQLVTEDKKSKFADRVCSVFSESGGHVELKLRFTSREHLGVIGENINLSTMINDGVFEINQNGVLNRSSCFLIQTDFNTLEENSVSRFPVPSLKSGFDNLVNLTLSKVKNISSKF
ncbi:hypothetical protein [Shewanella sp. ANA-3]|uniref:hypothetical protein n=1 Tax=Shewanella sp. (strain ANA-3) TaxID=94122 RepID=UPI0002E4D5E4|nr:hypothetical protein [Shewanella sp. ANA-3]